MAKVKNENGTVQPMKVSLNQLSPAQRWLAKKILEGGLDFETQKQKNPALFEDGKIEQYLREHGYFDKGEE